MSESFVLAVSLADFELWKRLRDKRALVSFDLEITARCNNNCRHCYINLPAGDREAISNELSFEEIKEICDEAVSLGALWCLITGGEPLLRNDFIDIYLYLKKRGLLVSVFTNATMISKEHVELFKKYPPRDIEVSVYGVTEETYEKVTRRRGSFSSFLRGLDLLIGSGIRPQLKAMALRSNYHEVHKISGFCREKTKNYFRFDPFLHLRFDGDPVRNEEIKSERLSPEQVIALENSDTERMKTLKNGCDKLIISDSSHVNCNHLFHCGTGNGSFSLSYDGLFRLCSSLWHPDCVYDLKSGSLADAWNNFVCKVRDMRSDRQEYLKNCRACSLINLCMWCPAHAYLETGGLDKHVGYFCEVCHARAKMVECRRTEDG